MSTSANLPAGASIISISGKKCTAIPRTDASFLNSILASALVPSSFSVPAATTAITTTSVAVTSAAPAAIVTSTPIFTDASPAADVNQPSQIFTSSTTIVTSLSVQAFSAPTLTAVVSSSPSVLSSISSSISLPSPLPTFTPDIVLGGSSIVTPPQPSTSANSQAISIPTDTVAAKTTSSTSSTFPIAQSEVSAASTPTSDGTLSGTQATTTSSSATLASSSTAAQPITTATHTSSKSKMPMVAGILGGIAIIGIVGFILWFLRRRRRRRDSFLTPLGSDPRDLSRSPSQSSNGEPISPIEKIRSQVGSKFAVVASSLSGVKNRVTRGRNNGVNMDRGNSQFLEQIPQHSRQNSAFSGQQTPLTAKERFGEWFSRMKEESLFILRVKFPLKEKDPPDSYYATREKHAHSSSSSINSNNADFSQLLAMEETEQRIESERRRQSLANASNLGSLGLNFDNPFADPPAKAQINPFADSAAVISTPQPSQHPASGYVADVRRSRGLSISQETSSRYPSTYAPDRDTYGYRDTYMSSNTNGRKTKGRSDPFDLEKLQLEASNAPMPKSNNSLYMNGYNHATAAETNMRPRVVSDAVSEASSAGTYSSKYSSGALSGKWGDPGPDLGSLNSESYLRQAGGASGNLRRSGTNGSERSVGKAL